MNFEALDGTKLLILMIAGAVFAAVGLYLLLKPRAEGAAKIEIFGLKFESSSAGLLVFVIGAAFLAIPLFAPEKATHTADVVVGSSSLTPDGGASTEHPPVLLPADAGAEEVEPNDRVQDANQVPYGATIGAYVSEGDEDWYVLALPEPPPRRIEMRVRHVSGSYLYAHLYDAEERKINKLWLTPDDGAKSMWMEVGSNARIYAKVVPQGNASTDYEITFSEGPDR